MNIRVISQLVSLALLVLLIALLGSCGALSAAEQVVDQAEDQVEQKLDQVEEQVENGLDPASGHSGGNAAPLTLEQAQEIALNHAGFTADQVTHLHGEYDMDDGRPEYEVEFIQGELEYDYTIHGDTGDILEFDKDSIYD